MSQKSKNYSPFNCSIKVTQIPELLRFVFNTGEFNEDGTPIYSRNINKNTSSYVLTPAFFGPSGIGKSQIIKQFADSIGADLIVVYLAHYKSEDLSGLPCYGTITRSINPNSNIPKGADINEKEGTYTMKISSFVPPEMFITNGKPTVLFLDEISACPPDIQLSVYSLLLEGKLGTVTLPDNCLIVGSGNRDQDHVPAMIFRNQALTSRLTLFEVTPDREGWIKWGKEKAGRIHPIILTFMDKSPEADRVFNTRNTIDPVTGTVRLVSEDSRVWEAISDLIYQRDKVVNGLSFLKADKKRKTEIRSQANINLGNFTRALLSESTCVIFKDYLNSVDVLPPIKTYFEIIKEWEKTKDSALLNYFKDPNLIYKDNAFSCVPKEDLHIYNLIYALSDYLSLELNNSSLTKKEIYEIWYRTFIFIFECIESRTKRGDQIHFQLIYDTLIERINVDSISEVIDLFSNMSDSKDPKFNEKEQLRKQFDPEILKYYEFYSNRMLAQIGGGNLNQELSLNDDDDL